MFRLLLSTSILVSASVFGQMTQTPISLELAQKKVPVQRSFELTPELSSQPTEQRADVRISPNQIRTKAGFNEMIIGNTQYDLQTNASIQNRFIRNGDDLTGIWTQSLQVSPFADRGTGLNSSSDGGDTWGDTPFIRVEDIRIGWPNVLQTTGGRQVIISHDFPTQLYMAYKDAGDSDWTESPIETSVPQGVSWSRAVSGGVDGNSIHMIYITMTPGNQSDDPPLTYEGQDVSLLYSRSTDQGDTWDIHEMILEELDSNSFLYFGPDAYAIHARGDKIAFAAFNDFGDSVVMISEDNGDSWTKKTFFDFPVDLYNGDDEIIDLDEDEVADIVPSTCGSGAVFIDEDMTVHIAFGHMNYQDDVLGDDLAFVYYPFTDGLAYWNDTMEENAWVDVAFSLDVDESGELELASDFVSYGSDGLLSMPQFAQDEAGDLFLTYSGIVESHATGNQNYHHIYFMKSEDGGGTWSEPVDGTPDEEYIGFECVYPAMVPNANDRLHLIYQRDFEPGLHVQGDLDPVDLNDIVYLYVTTDLDFTSIEESNLAFDIYPNPATDQIRVDVDAKIELYSITDMGGRVVSSGNSFGGDSIDVSTLSSGAYILSLATSKGISKQQFIKE